MYNNTDHVQALFGSSTYQRSVFTTASHSTQSLGTLPGVVDIVVGDGGAVVVVVNTKTKQKTVRDYACGAISGLSIVFPL